jgi:hypothetical protein
MCLKLRQFGFFGLVLYMGITCFIVSNIDAQAQVLEGLGGLTVDAALNKAADRVDSSVEKAGSVADGVAIRAGSEVNAEINNFREAYKDMLQKTVSSLDAEATKQLSQIFSNADALERKTAADAKTVLALAQQTANILPVAGRHPQVSLVEPTYDVFSPTRKDDITLTVDGNFYYVAEKEMTPYIDLGPNHIEPAHATTQHMLFMVPRTVLAPSGKPTSYVKLQLVVPYQDGLIVKSRHESRFPILLVGIPESAGKLSLEIRTPVQSSRVDHIRTPTDNQQSDRDDHTDTHCGQNESDPIDPNSVKLVVEHSEGSTWTQHPVRVNNPSVCYWFRTEHHGIGTSDKVWFHFEYNVTRTINTTSVSTQTMDVDWGSSHVFPVSAGNFTIRFDAFDGSHQEYIAENHDNRFIDISTEGGGLRISGRPIDGILPVGQ